MSIKQRHQSTSWSRRRSGRIAGVAVTALLASTMASGALTPAYAATAGIGPVDATGFPSWFSDGTNRLDLCLAGPFCAAPPLPNPAAPVAFPGNFPDEAFYFMASATLPGSIPGLYEAALEGSFTNAPDIIDGEQMGFARTRIKMTGLTPNATYRITHPYGVIDLDASNLGVINYKDDAGQCVAAVGTPCNWAGVGAAFIGNNAATTTSPFLTQVGAPAGFLGDNATDGPVTGGPNGNAVIVQELNNLGAPISTFANVSNFVVQGRISTVADGAPSMPRLAATSDSGRSNSDLITKVTTPTLTGTALAGSSVDILDGGTVVATTTATGGLYSVTLPTRIGGTHTVQARTAGLTSGTLSFVVDTTAPTVNIVSFPSFPSEDNTPTLGYSSGEADTEFECQLLPSSPTFTACVSPHTYDAQVNGPYTFNVRGTDVAGNLSTVATRAMVIGANDINAPTVQAKSPADGATVVSQTANLTATLSENVTGVNGTTFTLRNATTGAPVAASVSYTAPGIATLDPTATLAAGTRYTATLSSGIMDGFSLPLAATSWNFSTGPRPTITSRTQTLATTNISQLNNLQAKFNRSVTGVNGSTFTLKKTTTGARVGSVVSYNKTTRWATLNPSANLAPATRYTATLTSAIKDLAGNALTTKSWSFSTGPRPTVLRTSPAANTLAVSRYSNAYAKFSENVAGISSTKFILRNTRTGARIPATVSYSATTRTAKLNPSVKLAGNTRYTATLSSLIRDAEGNRITLKSWRFTTRR